MTKVMEIFKNKIEGLNAKDSITLNSDESNEKFAENYKVETKEGDGVVIDFLLNSDKKVIASRYNEANAGIENDRTMEQQDAQNAYNDFNNWLNS